MHMSLVHFALDDGVGILTLDNPPLNLVTRQLTRDLEKALAVLEANRNVRAVVVCGAGSRAFSAGSDIKEFPSLMDRGTVVEEKLSFENEVFSRLAGLSQPTLAAIVGLALGGGAELALCCDYRIVSAGARIGFPEIHLGTAPGSGGLSRLPRLIGPSRAMALLLDGRQIGADEALGIGLANEVVETSRCLDVAVARARQWAARASTAARAIKQGVLHAGRDEICDEVNASLEVSRAIFATADMREGVAAFLEKRSPRFRAIES
jgi:enoyl-CoA hydratase/carnithine racemase